jgi:hypothetical protein
MKKITVIVSLFISSFGAWGQGFLIETPEMLVFYEGIPIEIQACATGNYKNVVMSVPSPFTAASGSAGSIVVVSLSGTDSEGNSVSLGTKKFLVKKAPKPELIWNGVSDGGRAMRSGGSLACVYGNNVPFNPSKGKFEILSYSIVVEGVKGSLEGTGSAISSSHLNALKSIKGDSRVTITVKYTGSGNGIISGSFQI